MKKKLENCDFNWYDLGLKFVGASHIIKFNSINI